MKWYCRTCDATREHAWRPTIACVICQRCDWRMAGEPKPPYALSVTDVQFLKTNRINPEVPPVES